MPEVLPHSLSESQALPLLCLPGDWSLHGALSLIAQFLTHVSNRCVLMGRLQVTPTAARESRNSSFVSFCFLGGFVFCLIGFQFCLGKGRSSTAESYLNVMRIFSDVATTDLEVQRSSFLAF